MAWTAYVDDSGSNLGSDTYVLGCVILRSEQWTSFSERWQDVLDEEPKLEFFKASAVGGRTEGPFQGFTDPQRIDKVEWLVAVLSELNPTTFSASVKWSAFQAFKAKHVLTGAFINPYLFLYYSLLRMGIEFCQVNSYSTPIDFVFDRHNKLGDEVQGWYDYFKDHVPVDWLSLLGEKPFFADDKKCLPLQAADVFAWYSRRSIIDDLMPWHEVIWQRLSKYYSPLEMDCGSLVAMAKSFGVIK